MHQPLHILAAVSLLFIAGALCGQQRQHRDLHYESAFQPRGWFFAPGITWMWPDHFREKESRISNAEQTGDTLYSGTFRAMGRPGLYLEGGRHRFVEGYYFIHHLDYGIHFRMLRGRESFEGRVKADSTLVETQNRGLFSESFAGAFFNVSSIMQLSDVSWLHHSFGLNAEYRVISRRSFEGISTGMQHVFPEAFQGQLHYKLGWGWKADPGLYVLLSVETPILNLYPFYDGKSTLPYFTTRYRPLTLSCRIMFLDKTRSKSCENQPGQKPSDLNRDNPGRHQGSDLFGPDVRPKGKKKRRIGA